MSSFRCGCWVNLNWYTRYMYEECCRTFDSSTKQEATDGVLQASRARRLINNGESVMWASFGHLRPSVKLTRAVGFVGNFFSRKLLKTPGLISG